MADRGTGLNGASVTGLASLNVQAGINNTTDDRISITLGNMTQNTGLGLGTTDLASATSAQLAIADIDAALDSVNTIRSNYGALSNRLESTLRSIDTYAENLKAAESQIRDADFAHEAAEMSKLQIMQQAGTAILGQQTKSTKVRYG